MECVYAVVNRLMKLQANSLDFRLLLPLQRVNNLIVNEMISFKCNNSYANIMIFLKWLQYWVLPHIFSLEMWHGKEVKCTFMPTMSVLKVNESSLPKHNGTLYGKHDAIKHTHTQKKSFWSDNF